MSLRPRWAHGGVALADRRVLPALFAVCWLGLVPTIGHALSADPMDIGPAEAEAASRAAAPAAAEASTRLTIALAGNADEHPGGVGRRAGRLAADRGRLTITLFTGGKSAELGPALLFRPGQAPGMEGLEATTAQGSDVIALLTGGRRSPGSREATLYRLDYAGGPLELKGHVVDVGSRFSLSSEGVQPSAQEAELIKQALGGRGMNLGATWGLAPGLSLTSSHDNLRRDDILSEQHGLTTSNTSHALTLNLGPSSSLKASLTHQREEWDRWLGRAGKQRQEQRVEFASTFGAGGASGLRLAMTTVRSTEGDAGSQQHTQEVHLNLAPAGPLRLSADYLAKGSADGSAQTTKTVGAALKLAPEAELKATMNALDNSAGERKQESALALTAKVLGGQLSAEQKLTHAGIGLTTSRKYGFVGALGNGAGRANLKLDFQESRGDRADAPLTRNAFLHLDRQVLPWLTLTAERREGITGTSSAPVVSGETKYLAVARLGGKTELQAGLVTGAHAGVGRGERRLGLSHEWRGARLRAENGMWDDAEGSRSVLRYSLEVPTGELPDWAKALSAAHQFEDAQQYYLGRKPEWLGAEMPFAGYRLWTVRRQGGDHGVNSAGFAHRRIVAGRYHLQLNFEHRPEGTESDGEYKGRPLPLRREAVEIGGPVIGGVNLRCGVGAQTGVASDDNRLGRLKLGLWGKLGKDEQVEAEVWRERGEWDDAAVERASVALLYSHRVSDENRVELKLGYTWRDEGTGDRSRDCRFTLAYEKGV